MAVVEQREHAGGLSSQAEAPSGRAHLCAALIDGKLSRGACKLLRRYATHHGLSRSKVNAVIRQTKTHLLLEAGNGLQVS